MLSNSDWFLLILVLLTAIVKLGAARVVTSKRRLKVESGEDVPAMIVTWNKGYLVVSGLFAILAVLNWLGKGSSGTPLVPLFAALVYLGLAREKVEV